MVSPAELALPSDPSMDTAPAAKRDPLISDELFPKLVAKDPDAWSEFFTTSFPRLTGIAGICRNPQDQEDAAMKGLENFVKAITTEPEEPEKNTNPSGLLAVCVRRAAIDILRRQQRDPSIPASVLEEKARNNDHDFEEFLDVFDSPQSPTENTAVARMELANVLTTIETMRPQRQAAVLMTALGYEYEEIAERTGQAKGTVQSGVSRARDFLKREVPKKPTKQGKIAQPLDPEILKDVKQQIREIVLFSAA